MRKDHITPPSAKLQLIQDAIKNNKTLDIEYESKYGSLTSRKIKPIRIMGSLVVANCYLRGGERTFNINRIKIPVAKSPSLSSIQ